MDREFKIRCSAIGKIMGNSRNPGELSATCKNYLKEWYANDNEEISSKYINKGQMVEIEAIDFMVDVLGLGYAVKNFECFENNFLIGTPDVITSDSIYDVKSAWNRKTLLDQAMEPINSDYEWQLRGYMHLCKKTNAILFHALMDTPEECNYGNEVTYSHLEENKRWFAFKVVHEDYLIENVYDKVIKCREWLNEYDKSINNKLGKIN